MPEGHWVALPEEIVVRPAPDNGVTVQGVGLWPDGPKDHKGFVYGTKGPWTVKYNFTTQQVEAIYNQPDDPLSGPKALTWGIIIVFLMSAAFLSFFFLGWIF